MATYFSFYGYKGQKKSGKCPKCGKKATRTKDFTQSINPWNKKTLEQIYEEEKPKMEAWEKTPTYHKKCEPTPTCTTCGWTVPFDFFMEQKQIGKDKPCPRSNCCELIKDYRLVHEEDK